MKNLFISNLHLKDADHFTSDLGLYLRRKTDIPFKKLCNIFTNANIIRMNSKYNSDDEYFLNLDDNKVPLDNYNLKPKKNNIVLERYPKLEKDEPYIFVANHTCPEDIETILNIIDRNAYLVLGSIESLQYNKEMYLSWLNGMIPFDILDNKARKEVMDKMIRVLKTNSILIFPEGSHNHSPNKIINNLFDGPANLAKITGRKIVLVSLLKDHENNVSYIDVSNPININDIELPENIDDKAKIKAITSKLRDNMATAVYHMIDRHTDMITRQNYDDVEEELRKENVEDAFKKLKWDRDVFDAEYLVKETKEEKDYAEVIETISNLNFNIEVLKEMKINNREYILKKIDLERKNVPEYMRKFLNNKKLIKR